MSAPTSLTLFDKDTGNLGPEQLSAFTRPRSEDPAGYIIADELKDAINASILLGQPLLLTGAPGVGKTSVGRTVAHAMGLPLLEFTVKSTSRAGDLFYEYDAVGRFQAAEANRAEAARYQALTQLGADMTEEQRRGLVRQAEDNPRDALLDYIEVQALGRAILNALASEAAGPLLKTGETHAPRGRQYTLEAGWQDHVWAGSGPLQSVVIIDEIDKAPSDFCNDLLDELDHMRFRVPELANHMGAFRAAPEFGDGLPAGLRPIVFITSNQERPLPDAFLRRCCYHHIAMPEGDDLDRIITQRISADARLNGGYETALDTFQNIRGVPGLSRQPGLAELLNWLRYLAFSERTGGADLEETTFLKRSLTALIKEESDRNTVIRELGLDLDE